MPTLMLILIAFVTILLKYEPTQKWHSKYFYSAYRVSGFKSLTYNNTFNSDRNLLS